MSEILTKDDFTQTQEAIVNDSEEREIAVQNIMASITDLEEVKEVIFTQNSIASISFTFGTYYVDLKRKLENVLNYLENDRSTK